MSVRLGDSTAGTIERWISGLGGPTLTPDPVVQPGSDDAPKTEKCPICDAPRRDQPAEPERYDEDFEYYWGNFKVPLWIALIWQVPWRQRLDIFMAGLIIGLTIAGIAVIWGLLISQY
jgi:hypothetical protein